MYYFKQINEDNTIAYFAFSFKPKVSGNMYPMTEEEYILAIKEDEANASAEI
jgi:hypothetical protein